MFLSSVTVEMKLLCNSPRRLRRNKIISELPLSREPLISNRLYMVDRSLLNAARCHKEVLEKGKLELSW
jgi:hypothetical protein